MKTFECYKLKVNTSYSNEMKCFLIQLLLFIPVRTAYKMEMHCTKNISNNVACRCIEIELLNRVAAEVKFHRYVSVPRVRLFFLQFHFQSGKEIFKFTKSTL